MDTRRGAKPALLPLACAVAVIASAGGPHEGRAATGSTYIEEIRGKPGAFRQLRDAGLNPALAVGLRRDAVKALAESATPEAEAGLREVAMGANGAVQREAVLALSDYDSPKTAQLLVRLAAPGNRAAAWAVDALTSDSRHKHKIARLRTVVLAAKKDENLTARMLTRLARARIVEPAPVVRDLAESNASVRIRMQAYAYLAAVQDRDSYEFLVEQAKDTTLGTTERRAAVKALVCVEKPGRVLPELARLEEDRALRVEVSMAQTRLIEEHARGRKPMPLDLHFERRRLQWDRIEKVRHYVVALKATRTPQQLFVVAQNQCTPSLPKGIWHVSVKPVLLDDFAVTARERFEGGAARLGQGESRYLNITSSRARQATIRESSPSTTVDTLAAQPERHVDRILALDAVTGQGGLPIHKGFAPTSEWMYFVLARGEKGAIPIVCERTSQWPPDTPVHIVTQLKRRIDGGYVCVLVDATRAP